LVGAVSDTLFQSYRAFRAIFRPKSFGYHLLDALVALILLTGLGVVVFIVNWGELRIYIPISMAFGALSTHGLVGNIVYRRSLRIFAGTKRGLDWSHRKVVVPTKEAVGRSAKWVKATLFPPIPPLPPAPPDSDEPRL
jgi:hypothetical protein